ncbi:hypothetical protein MKX08_003390 [Trichoderma sp. CBMAI-0020]|nr:hypothetical protein MKX08_003390 [Trichoderma sp. CBMAI-0020]
MQRRTRQEKRPPLLLGADVAQPLQIPHLANRRPPLAQQPLVQTTILGKRPGLPAHGVAGHGREVLRVEPADRVHVALDANEGEDACFGAGALDSEFLLVPADKACSDNENVALAALGALELEHLFQLGRRDGVGGYGRGRVFAGVLKLPPSQLRLVS